MKPGVLIVEDDPKAAEIIRLYLERDGYPVSIARNGVEGLEMAYRDSLAVVLLDVMLPELDGMAVCKTLRAKSDVGFILVTARSSEADTLLGLDLGADDYITKPFRPRELLARVRALIRRRNTSPQEELEVICAGELTIDARRHQVRVRDEDAGATPREFQLLRVMASEPGRAFTRLDLLDRAFGYSFEGLERTVDAHIRNLRRKIEPDPDRPTYIETVYGVGYRFAERTRVP